MNYETIIIHTDGGSRGNPGKAACAFVAEEKNIVINKSAKFLGIATNNVAEYKGVLLALDWILETKVNADKIIFFLDSELVVRQLKGIYKIKNIDLQTLSIEIFSKIKKIATQTDFENVPREENKIADKLVNEELDKN